jgi:hypothetical protein
MALLPVALFFPFTAEAQIVIGDCNVVFTDVRVTGGSVTTGQIEGCPQAPEKTLRIGYFWLDSTSLSFLLSGQNYGAIRDLVGPRPIVVQNDVFKEAKYLVDKFGTQIDSSSFYADTFSVSVGTRTLSDNTLTFEDLGQNLLSHLKIYDGNDPIYFPDLPATATVNETLEWPENYHIYIKKDESEEETEYQLPSYSGDSPIDADELYSKLVLWRNVKRSELENYQDLLLQTRDEIKRAGNGLPWIPSEIQGYIVPSDADVERISNARDSDVPVEYDQRYAELQIEKIPNLASNKALRAMLYVSREGWPEDFLQSLGFFEGHGNVGSWGALAPPREMFVLVALIENMGGAGATYQLKGFNLQHSSETQLRTTPGTMTQTFLPFTLGAIGKDDKVVLPLKIEFRSNARVGRQDAPEDLSASPSSVAKISQALAPLSADTILKISDGTVQKKASAFSNLTAVPEITNSYIYGPVATLESLVIDDALLPVRQYAANGLFMVAGYEGGSCPTLYVKRYGETELVKIGKVLHTANGAAQSTTEEIHLGKNIEAVYILESEPERTIVKHLEILTINETNTSSVTNPTITPITIEWGEQALINVQPIENTEYLLRIEGYYERYNDVASGSLTSELPRRENRR